MCFCTSLPDCFYEPSLSLLQKSSSSLLSLTATISEIITLGSGWLVVLMVGWMIVQNLSCLQGFRQLGAWLVGWLSCCLLVFSWLIGQLIKILFRFASVIVNLGPTFLSGALAANAGTHLEVQMSIVTV